MPPTTASNSGQRVVRIKIIADVGDGLKADQWQKQAKRNQSSQRGIAQRSDEIARCPRMLHAPPLTRLLISNLFDVRAGLTGPAAGRSK